MQRSHVPGLTTENYSEAKQLPIDFLKSVGIMQTTVNGIPTVSMQYIDTDGVVKAVRQRQALSGPLRFRWRNKDKPLPYGLWRLEDARSQGGIPLVEGESCAQTLWLHDMPALGLPGAAAVSTTVIEALLSDIPGPVFVVVEPDKAGETLLDRLAQSSLRDRIRVVRLEPFKDTSAMYLDDPASFPARWARAIETAAPLPTIEVTTSAAAEQLWETCAPIATAQRILDRFAEAIRESGVVGEERNAKVLYLALTSRLFDRPVSVAVKGVSSGGKSFLTGKVLDFFPPSAFHALTAMSEKSLIYSERPLSHRFLVLYEADGMLEGIQAYVVRSLLSEGQVRYETVENISGELKAREIVREGPTGLIVTTTHAALHSENETRMISLTIDDSAEQTRQVMLAMSIARPMPDLTDWIALQEWIGLRPTAVVIPYETQLVSLVDPRAVRLRRDIGALLRLVAAHATLHQANRAREGDGRIVASLDDYAVVRELVHDLIATGVSATVHPNVRAIVETIATLQTKNRDGVSLPMLVATTGREKSVVSRHASQAAAAGYVRNHEQTRGRPARYKIGETLPEDVEILPTIEVLADRCTVAVGSEETTTLTPALRETAFLHAVDQAARDDLLSDISLMVADEQVMCRFPKHKPTWWEAPGGRLVCGTCHPRSDETSGGQSESDNA